MDEQGRETFRAYVAARSPALLRTAYLLTGNRADAEDLLQTSLAKTYLAWDRIREREAVDGYVRRVMVNTQTSWWRRRRVDEYPTSDLPERASGRDTTDDLALHDALWTALADGSLDLVATDHVPDRLAVEKRLPAPPFPAISNGAPGIETLLAIVWSEGVATGRLTPERAVDLLATTPARRFGLRSKGAIEVGRDADLVLFDPAATRVVRAADLHHTSDYTPYEGREVTGAVRAVFVRGRSVVRDGAFVGERGFGRFVERAIEW
jgi:dihydropyrimidinase